MENFHLEWTSGAVESEENEILAQGKGRMYKIIMHLDHVLWTAMEQVRITLKILLPDIHRGLSISISYQNSITAPSCTVLQKITTEPSFRFLHHVQNTPEQTWNFTPLVLNSNAPNKPVMDVQALSKIESDIAQLYNQNLRIGSWH